MTFFFESVIRPLIEKNKFRKGLEIGASKGRNTLKLLEINNVQMTIVDPCLDADLVENFKGNNQISMYRGKSLDILPVLTNSFDFILIDGDHNWYTVFNELKMIREKGLLESGGIIFLHDVGWPYGRRDMYYIPDSIPQEYRKPYAKKGIIRDQSALVDVGGDDKDLNNAQMEGGQHNGVLTAVEDFYKEYKRDYMWFCDMRQYGLGILMKKKGLFENLRFIQFRISLGYDHKYEKTKALFVIHFPFLAKILRAIKHRLWII